MNKQQDYSFTVINKEGIEVKCDVLSMISDKDSRIYLLYTDYLLNEKGDFRVLASELVQKKNDYILKDIDDTEKLEELVRSSKNLFKKTLHESTN